MSSARGSLASCRWAPGFVRRPARTIARKAPAGPVQEVVHVAHGLHGGPRQLEPHSARGLLLGRPLKARPLRKGAVGGYCVSTMKSRCPLSRQYPQEQDHQSSTAASPHPGLYTGERTRAAQQPAKRLADYFQQSRCSSRVKSRDVRASRASAKAKVVGTPQRALPGCWLVNCKASKASPC